MVSANDIKLGQLLVSDTHKLFCVIEINLCLDDPDSSIIIGINEKNVKFEGTPDKWFYLWNSSIDISKINFD